MERFFSIVALLWLLLFSSSARINENHGKLKIISWNIYMLPSPFPIHKIKRAHLIGEYLGKSDYDIIVLQEAFDRHARAIIYDYLSTKYPYHIAPVNVCRFSIKTNSGIWILSKIPIRLVKEINFRNCQGVDCLSRKGAVMIEGRLNASTFQLIGTHLESGGPDEIRVNQCLEIKNLLLDPNKRNDVPQIICGDFNTKMHDEMNYSLIKEILSVDNFEVCGDIKFSFDGKGNDLKNHGDDQCVIDYIFLRRNGRMLKSMRTNIHAFKKYWKKNHQDVSDHYSIMAEIEF
jgi:endonuclease/exonuclease/phosphatase family metal-dependent hydrolase